MQYQTREQVLQPEVIEACEALHKGLMTVTQTVRVLLAWDVNLQQIEGNKFTLMCESDWTRWLKEPLPDVGLLTTPSPPEFVVEV